MKDTKFIFFSIILASLLPNPAFATISGDLLTKYAENNILYYDPCEGGTSSGGSFNGECGGTIEAECDGYARLKELVEKYGVLAMNLQITYGIPWEIVFAQTQKENQVSCDGKTSVFLETIGRHNTLGLNFNDDQLFSLSDAAETNSRYSQYATWADMIASQVIDFYRNSGYGGFEYLDPNNYDTMAWFRANIPKYCPVDDGCDPVGYANKIEEILNVVYEVADEQGWPTSAELAKQENIQIGGQYPDVDSDLRTELGTPHKMHIVDCSGTIEEVDDLASYSGNENLEKSNNISTTTTSNVTWSDGWIVDGMEGYTKEEAGDNAEKSSTTFRTTKINSQDPGPNKILLHSTEGTNRNKTEQMLSLYNSGTGTIFPAHFTIDLKTKRVHQHYPITHPADSIKYYDDLAGIQIEIIGFGEGSNTNSEWYLPSDENFSNTEWDYLATLLIAISSETGIPLTTDVEWKANADRLSKAKFKSYEGILGHMHATSNDHNDPQGIWDKVEAAVERGGGVINNTTDECGNNIISSASGDVSSLQATIAKYAWPDHRGDYLIGTDEWKKVGDPQADCGHFVGQTMIDSGWDKDYPSQGTSSQASYLKESKKWEEITDQVSSEENLQPGDVLIIRSDAGLSQLKGCKSTFTWTHHTLLYGGEIEKFENTFMSASQSQRVPMADNGSAEKLISCFHIFRKTK